MTGLVRGGTGTNNSLRKSLIFGEQLKEEYIKVKSMLQNNNTPTITSLFSRFFTTSKTPSN